MSEKFSRLVEIPVEMGRLKAGQRVGPRDQNTPRVGLTVQTYWKLHSIRTATKNEICVLY